MVIAIGSAANSTFDLFTSTTTLPDESGYDHVGAHWDLLEERGLVYRSREIGSKYRPDDVPMTYTATSLALL
jgi:DNA-binding transcriptional ArsR family regulator